MFEDSDPDLLQATLGDIAHDGNPGLRPLSKCPRL
jgi:hypothetical protein